jgi:hypothetical protein
VRSAVQRQPRLVVAGVGDQTLDQSGPVGRVGDRAQLSDHHFGLGQVQAPLAEGVVQVGVLAGGAGQVQLAVGGHQ